MKNFISLYIINLKQILKRQKLLYFIFTLFLIFSVFSICFTQNIYTNLIKSAQDYATKTYFVQTNDYTNLIDNFNNLINVESKNIAYINCIIVDNGKAINSYYYNTDKTLEETLNGRWFTREELSQGKKVAIATHNHSEVYEVNSIIQILNEDYLVVGINNGRITIPFNSITDFTKINMIEIALKYKLDESNTQKVSKNLENYLNCKILTYPEIDTGLSRSITIIIIILLSISVFNILFLYQYIIETRMKMLGIFRIYGYTKNKTMLYFYFELLILFMLCLFLGFAMFILISKFEIFNNILYKNNLTLKNYAFTFVAFLVFSSFCYLPTIKKVTTKMPLEILKD